MKPYTNIFLETKYLCAWMDNINQSKVEKRVALDFKS